MKGIAAEALGWEVLPGGNYAVPCGEFGGSAFYATAEIDYLRKIPLERIPLVLASRGVPVMLSKDSWLLAVVPYLSKRMELGV